MTKCLSHVVSMDSGLCAAQGQPLTPNLGKLTSPEIALYWGWFGPEQSGKVASAEYKFC